MKKTILIAVVALLMVAFAATMVSAGPNTGRMPFAGGQNNYTDAQKAEMAPYFSKMNDLHLQMIEVRKEMIQKQVSFGYLTQEQADQHIARMQERIEQGQGSGNMMGRGFGKMGRGPSGNGCPFNQQQPTN